MGWGDYVISGAVQGDADICNAIRAPSLGVRVGSGIHVSPPADWQTQCRAGTKVPGCTAIYLEGSTLTIPPDVRAGLKSPAIRAGLDQAKLAVLDPKIALPPVGCIRWDGNSNNASLNWWTSAGLSKMIPAGSKFHHRKPTIWQDFQQWGTGVDVAAIVEAEIAAAAGKLDYWIYDTYEWDEDLPPADKTNLSNINLPFLAHVASPNKSRVKFSMMLQGVHLLYKSGAYLTAFCDRIANYMEDPDWQTIDGLPVLCFFDTAVITAGDWTTIKASIGEPGVDFFGIMLDGTASEATRLGLQAVGQYGPRNIPAGSGRLAYSAQVSADVAKWTIGGFQKVCTVTVVQDDRTFSPAGSFVDLPASGALLAHLINALQQSGCKTVVLYAWSEVAEGGPGIVPTYQEGSRFLDVVGWAVGNTVPTSFQEKMGFETLAFTSVGVWTEYFPDPDGVQGAHQGDLVISTDATASKQNQSTGVLGWVVWGMKGPDCGIFEFYEDGVLTATVDCYDTVSSFAPLVTREYVAPDKRTLKVQVTNTKNPSSSSTQVKLDYLLRTVVPQVT